MVVLSQLRNRLLYNPSSELRETAESFWVDVQEQGEGGGRKWGFYFHRFVAGRLLSRGNNSWPMMAASTISSSSRCAPDHELPFKEGIEPELHQQIALQSPFHPRLRFCIVS